MSRANQGLVTNPWSMARDGKRCFDPAADADLMRK